MIIHTINTVATASVRVTVPISKNVSSMQNETSEKRREEKPRMQQACRRNAPMQLQRKGIKKSQEYGKHAKNDFFLIKLRKEKLGMQQACRRNAHTQLQMKGRKEKPRIRQAHKRICTRNFRGKGVNKRKERGTEAIKTCTSHNFRGKEV